MGSSRDGHQHHFHQKQEQTGVAPCGEPIEELISRCCVCGLDMRDFAEINLGRMSFWQKLMMPEM